MNLNPRNTVVSGVPTWPIPPRHPRENERLESVMALIRGSEFPDPLMQSYARRAAELCQVAIGLVTLIGESEQRYMACVGLEGEGTERDSSFCAYTILENEPLVVEDARQDARFRNNPYVVGAPHVRFYAGSPLFDASGLPLGSVCVIDTEPRAITSKRLFALQDLARGASLAIESRRVLRKFVAEDRQEAAQAGLDEVFEKFSAR